MLIRRVKVKPPVSGQAQRIFPLPGDPVWTGPASVTIVSLTSGAIELLDDPTQAAGQGLALAGKAERTLAVGAGDELWALVGSGEQEAVVVAGGV